MNTLRQFESAWAQARHLQIGNLLGAKPNIKVIPQMDGLQLDIFGMGARRHSNKESNAEQLPHRLATEKASAYLSVAFDSIPRSRKRD
jgi:hypothetical protein